MTRKQVVENLHELLELIINDYNYFGGSEDEERKYNMTVSEAIALLEENRSKSYIAKFTLFDGEHVYYNQFLLKASNHEEATHIAKSQEHGYDEEDKEKELTYFNYCDGTTEAKLKGVIEITEKEAATLQRLGLAFYFQSGEKEERETKRMICINNSTFEDCLTVGKYYEVEIRNNDDDMYYLLDDNNEQLNTLSYHFTE